MSDYKVDNFPDEEVKRKEDDELKTKGSAGSIRKEPVPSLNRKTRLYIDSLCHRR